LIELGYAKAEKKSYQLTPRVLRLGFAYLSQVGLDGRIQPLIDDVARELGESCVITVLDGLEVVAIAQAPSPRFRMSFSFKPGTRMPAYAMTSGRVLLAAKSDEEVVDLLRKMDRKAITKRTRISLKDLQDEIRQIRAKGFAMVEEELEPSLLSIAVPIQNRRGQTVAALAVSSSSTRTSIEELRDNALQTMLRAAAEAGKLIP
jgi:IclR family pca regulon transcriptional regulator